MANSDERKHDLTVPNKKYVSCIKIHGLRILPPILSDEKRKKMQYYKELAIKVEEKIKLRKLNRCSIGSTDDGTSPTYIDSEDSSISDSVIYSSDKSSIEEPTYKSQIFSESCRADVLQMLKDKSQKNGGLVNSDVVELPLLDTTAISKVPLYCSNESDMKKCLAETNNLPSTNINISSKNVISVLNVPKQNVSLASIRQQSYTVSDSNKVFTDDVLKKLSVEDALKGAGDNSVNLVTNNKVSPDNNVDLNKNNEFFKSPETNSVKHIHSDRKFSPPPLIRSNSYILDTPSPLLLALMQQNNVYNIESTEKNSESVGRKRRTWDLVNAREKWSSIEHDLNYVAEKHFKNNRNENFAFSSLPPSTAASPETKMFNSSFDVTTQPQKSNFKVYKSQLPEKESEIPTPEKPRQVKKLVIKTSDNPSRFIKSFVTPIRNTCLNKKAEKEFSPVKIQTEQKLKRTFETPTKQKTELIVKKHTPALMRQRKFSLDNMKTNQENFTPIILPKKPDILSSEKSEQHIREIIEKIHSEQSKQMANLITRQKKEQEALMKTFAEQQVMLLSTLRSTYRTPEDPINQTDPIITENNNNQPTKENDINAAEPEIIKNSENLLFECKKLLQLDTTNDDSSSSRNSNQTLYCTALSSPEDVTLTSDLTLRSDQNETMPSDYKTDSLEMSSKQSDVNKSINEPICMSAGSINYTRSYSRNSLEPICNGNTSKYGNRSFSSCSRQLFPTEKQIWAATKICALARGFLVRRLIKTERVQNLIKTIRDTLLCAMELHHETADNIQPADVELHRRLIQQVTSACHSFHDTFFDLPKLEQMSIIALDRERQKEKLLRPFSARSNASLSSTTQKFLERKLRRRSTDSVSCAPSRSSSSRSCHSSGEYRSRTKSLGMPDPVQCSNKKTSPQNEVMSRAMSYGANKKPWR